ncbi:MAG: transcription elongation factor GreA [Gammaproteobacteria bacterium]|jgi:transcription elongation factor GreA|nr:transcription elongation factor GreA [Gammaproteobacteria bacterium]
MRQTFTVAGHERLRNELERLKRVERPRIIQAIAEARSHGDLSENAEYHAAREEQSFVEGRIKELSAAISGAQLIDPATLAEEHVVFGATVTLFNSHTEGEEIYQIVGELEARIEHGQVSITSPLARALIGKGEGEEVEVRSPGGLLLYEIVSVTYR